MKNSSSNRRGAVSTSAVPAHRLVRRRLFLQAGAASLVAGCGGGGGGGAARDIAAAAGIVRSEPLASPFPWSLRTGAIGSLTIAADGPPRLLALGCTGDDQMGAVWIAPTGDAGVAWTDAGGSARACTVPAPSGSTADAIAAAVRIDGSIVLAWRAVTRPDPSQPGYELRTIRMRCFDRDGAATGDERVLAQQAYNPLFTTTDTDLLAPAIAARPDGSFVVAWVRARQSAAAFLGAQVEARRYGPGGDALGSIEMVGFNDRSCEFRLACIETGGLLVGVPVWDAAGRASLCVRQWQQSPLFELSALDPLPWRSSLHGLDAGGLLLLSGRDSRVFDADGSCHGAAVELDSLPTAAVALRGGGHAALWQPAAADAPWTAQLHDARGARASDRSALGPAPADALAAASAQGGIALAWIRAAAPGAWGLTIQRFDVLRTG